MCHVQEWRTLFILYTMMRWKKSFQLIVKYRSRSSVIHANRFENLLTPMENKYNSRMSCESRISIFKIKVYRYSIKDTFWAQVTVIVSAI